MSTTTTASDLQAVIQKEISDPASIEHFKVKLRHYAVADDKEKLANDPKGRSEKFFQTKMAILDRVLKNDPETVQAMFDQYSDRITHIKMEDLIHRDEHSSRLLQQAFRDSFTKVARTINIIFNSLVEQKEDGHVVAKPDAVRQAKQYMYGK